MAGKHFKIQRHIRQMGLETPVRAGVETCRSECAVYPKIRLVLLDAVGNSLELFKRVDLICRLDNRIGFLTILVQYRLVIDDAVGFHCIRDRFHYTV